MIWLIFIFIIVPAIEIALFLWAGAWLGILPVAAMIILTGIIGISLVKREGMETWQRAQRTMYNHGIPGEELIDGICIIVGGLCLLTPGFFTDTIGFLLVIPFTRRPFKLLITAYIAKRVSKGNITFRKY